MARVSFAVLPGTVPLTQNEIPWYAEASMQPIHMPSCPPHLVAWVLAMFAAYLLAFCPGPRWRALGAPVPSLES